MKAYQITSKAHDYSVIAYAESCSRAKRLAQRHHNFCDEEWTDLRGKLYPIAQQYVTEEPKLETRDEVYRDLEWWLEDESSCDCCGKADWSGGMNPKWRVCYECQQCGECGHEDDCPEDAASTPSWEASQK